VDSATVGVAAPEPGSEGLCLVAEGTGDRTTSARVRPGLMYYAAGVGAGKGVPGVAIAKVLCFRDFWALEH
jgi:hypothetical protein